MSGRATTNDSLTSRSCSRTGRGPLFAEPLHVGRPNLGDRQRLLQRFGEVLDRGWLTNHGPCVEEFEARIERLLGVRHCIAVGSATIGLQIATNALGLHGEVIVPSFTFPATAHALAWQGIRPVFCDVDPATHTIDAAQAERLITRNTTAILGVHLWGNPCAVESLTRVAERHSLRLLFDAAHAFGCSHQGRMIGNFGSAEVFSFHATKFLSTGEGGAITTNDDEVAEATRRLRNFGFVAGEVAGPGINGKMPELSAALGLTALESYDSFVARNGENLAAYASALAGIAGVRLCAFPSADRRNYQYVIVEVDQEAAGMSRDALLAALHAENVMAKRYFHPGCHRLPPYNARGEHVAPALPNTERLCGRLLQLPTGMAVSRTDIERIGEFLRSVLARARSAA